MKNTLDGRSFHISPVLPRLMLVTDRRETLGRDLGAVLAEAARGGLALVQVREKDLPDEALLGLVLRLKACLTPGTLLLVNGRPAVARAAGVGLHLAAHEALPQEPIPGLCGRAAHDEVEVRRALAEPISYLLVGPTFPTSSKPGHPGSGLELLGRLCRLASPIPVFAIGGITRDTVRAAIRAGAHGVAVRSAILSAPDPRRAAQDLIQAMAASA